MSLLPQRKKSPEEIARLRESLGVPTGAAHEESPPPPPAAETLIPHTHAADVVKDTTSAPLSPLPTPKAVHSLKKSEQLPLPRPAPPPTAVVEQKPVRSLRKSEMAPSGPLKPPEPDGDGRIPFRRHSEREIEEIRRREALAMLNAPPPNPKLFPAHPALIAPGYGLATAAAACFVFESFPMAATAGCIVAALLVAIAILCFRPVSRHHSAFIFIIALFVLVFAALHYFPHLRHAT